MIYLLVLFTNIISSILSDIALGGCLGKVMKS